MAPFKWILRLGLVLPQVVAEMPAGALCRDMKGGVRCVVFLFFFKPSCAKISRLLEILIMGLGAIKHFLRSILTLVVKSEGSVS